MRYKRHEMGNFLKLWETYRTMVLTSSLIIKEQEYKFLRKTGVHVDTIGRWIQGREFPSGMNLIRLWYLFSDRGYEVTDLQHMYPEVRELGRALAYQKTNFEEIHKILGYRTKASAIKMLRGRNAPSTKRREKIKDFLEIIGSKKSAEENSGDQEMYADFSANSFKAVSRIKKPVTISSATAAMKRKPSAHTMRFLPELERIVPLLEALVFHKDATARTDLYELCGDEFERFQRLVRALASEDARAKILSEEGFGRFYARDIVCEKIKSKGGE